MAEIVSGSTPKREFAAYWGGEIRWASIRDVHGLEDGVVGSTAETITREGFRSCSTQLVPPGTVLFTSRAPIGLVAVAGVELCTNQGFKNFVPGPGVLSRYLYYYLRHEAGRIDALGTGATFKEVSKRTIGGYPIVFPPVEEQRRIADVLDKADAIRRKRGEALALTDELLRATFLEMFGDPVANPRGWPRRELAEFIAADDSINYGVVQPGAAEDTGIPIVRVGDFRGMSISQSGLMRIAPEIEAGHRRSRLNGREILVACVGSIGKVALVDESLRGFNIARAVARIPLGNELDRVFAAHLLTTDHVQHFWRNETRTVSQPTLNIRQICMTPIYLPPLEKQREFSRMAGLIAKTTQALEFSAAEMERLFAALQHRAFRGEL